MTAGREEETAQLGGGNNLSQGRRLGRVRAPMCRPGRVSIGGGLKKRPEWSQ